jgi:PAS domain S-box-containing protein/putative nucleotidyltransferase with HDIG domain
MMRVERNIMEKAKILVVEDERITAVHLTRTLEKLGYQAVGNAQSGQEAIDLSLEHLPDLILMDIMLKGDMTGIEAAKHIHEKSCIPVIYLTAYADDDMLKKAMITEPYGYILKPFEERELHSNIEIALYKHRSERTLKKSEEKYRDLTENAVSAIFIIQDGKTIYANPSASMITGYSHDDLAQMDFFVIVHPDFRDTIIEKHAEQLLEIRMPQRYGFRYLRKNGESRWIDVNTTVIEHENRPAIMVEARDITEKKHSNEKLQQSMIRMDKIVKGITHAISYTIESRDPYTAGHQRRVANLASCIAANMNLSEEMTAGIYTAGLIHDIGKISVPAELLSKPGRLTKTEFDLIKAHSLVGYDILKNIDFPWPVADIVFQHHERINGSGYPNGLQAKDMLVEARIISVADVVEAMASHRPYRPALGIDEALGEITGNKGILYDKDAVAACLTVFEDNDFKFDSKEYMTERSAYPQGE